MQQTSVEIEKAAQILKLLGDKTRLTMISILQKQECCVCELVELFEMSQPSISQHLRKLKDAKIVSEHRKGQWIYYSLNKENEFYELIIHILKQIPCPHDKLKKIKENNTKLRFDC